MLSLKDFIIGSPSRESVYWPDQIQGCLTPIVTENKASRKKSYRINLQNHQTENLSNVATLITQLYAKGCVNFDLIQFNCGKNTWKNLIEQIGQQVRSSPNCSPVDLMISVEISKEPEMRKLLSEIDPQLKAAVKIHLFTVPPLPQRKPISSVTSSAARPHLPPLPPRVPANSVMRADSIKSSLGKRALQESNNVLCHNTTFEEDEQFICKVKSLMLKNGQDQSDLGKSTIEYSVENPQKPISFMIKMSQDLSHSARHLKLFMSTLNQSGIDHLILRQMPLDSTPKSLEFISTLMQNNPFSTITFFYCKFSGASFEKLASISNENLTTLRIDGTIEFESGKDLGDYLPDVRKSFPRLASFKYNGSELIPAHMF